MNNHLRIVNYLQDLVRTFDFDEVIFDKDSKVARFGRPVKPESAFCNETTSTFGSDRRYGRAEVRARLTWLFELDVKFACGVSLEKFEKMLTDPVLRLPRDAANGYDGVAFRLVRTTAKHPVQQSPSGGTEAKFIIEAVPGRK